MAETGVRMTTLSTVQWGFRDNPTTECSGRSGTLSYRLGRASWDILQVGERRPFGIRVLPIQMETRAALPSGRRQC
jgi:hypothetical protein